MSPNDVRYCLQQLDRDVVGAGRGVTRLDCSVLCFIQRDFLRERYLTGWADRDPWVRDVIRCRAAFKSAASQRCAKDYEHGKPLSSATLWCPA